MEFIDYYKVLGVERGATPEEIAKAYRRLARKFHPDVNKDAGAEDQFKRVNEANQVLSDPEKRRRYDTLGANWRDGQPFRPPPEWGDGTHVEFHTYPGGGFGGGGGGWSDFFEAIFGGGMAPGARRGRGARGRPAAEPFGRRGPGGFPGAESLHPGMEDMFGDAFGARAGPQRRRGSDIEGEMEIAPEDALHGATRTVQLRQEDGAVRTYEIKIPAGVHDGARIRLAGRGGPGGGGAESGDLLLTIRLAADSRFRVEGEDLVVVVPVAPWEAALGASLPVPTLDGPVQLKLPAGRSSGDRLRLRGKGLPRAAGGRGDLFAELRIVVPGRLSDRERRLFEELREESAFRPREEPHEK